MRFKFAFNFTQFFFLFALILAPRFAIASVNKCLYLFGKNHHSLDEVSSTKFAPKSSFDDFRKSDSDQTVFTVRRTKTHIVLRKAKDQVWFSEKNMFEGGDTPQGDPRTLVLIAGTKIGRFLGFRLSSDADFVELHVPLVHYFKSKLAVLNRLLMESGQEPILFNLKKTGLATDREIVAFSRQKKNQTIFHFPFDDADPFMLIHEYSYHLAGILFPNSVVKRASQVSDRLLEFLKSIERNPEMKEVIQILLKERTLQLDAGTARITITLLMLRYLYPELTFSELADRIELHKHTRAFEIFEDALEYLTQSSTTPAGSVLLSVVMWIGVGHDLAPSSLQQGFKPMSQLLLYFHSRPKLTAKQTDYLMNALRSFSEKYSDEISSFGQSNSNQLSNDPAVFLKEIDVRIKSIERVLPPSRN